MPIRYVRKLLPLPLKRALKDHDLWYRVRLDLLAKPFYSGIGSILALHRVCPQVERPRLGFNKDLEITPELLEEAIKFFERNNYRFVALDEVAYILKSGRSNQRFVSFTIDDGYADNLEHAYPVFRRHKIPFTVYVTNCFPNRTAILWWYLLEDLLWRESEVEAEMDGRLLSLDCSTPEKKEEAFDLLAGHFTHSDVERRGQHVKTFFTERSLDPYDHVNRLALSWEQVAELSRDPLVTVGAHTLNHYALSKLSRAEAEREMLESKSEIEARIGKEVRHLAYPYGGRGAASERDFALAKECGFETATTTRSGNIFFSHREHVECLPRIELSGAKLVRNADRLNLWVNGIVPCHENGFRRVVTV